MSPASSGPARTVRRGELYWVNWDPARGSEQAGYRPVLIVQTDAANTNPRYPNTIVVAVSTSGRPITAHVPLQPPAQSGLSIPSFAKCEQLITISKARLGERIGHIAPEELVRVEGALRQVLSLF